MMQSSLLLDQPSPSLLILPVEVLHRILDQLDAKDILFSFRNVCTRFRAITKSYNRLTIELTNHPSETDFNRLHRIISPENVGSLILRKYYATAEFDQIDRLFSSGDIHQFTTLRFVHLESIKERDFSTIMRHLITTSTLKSLKIFDRRLLNDDSIVLLSMVIALQSLHILDLDISSRIIDQISWPNHGTFRELSLRKCSYKQWCYILDHSASLRTASTANFDINNIDETIRSISYQQVASLTLSDIRFSIDQLEILLLSYPSLVHFNLTANENSSLKTLRRFSQWEHFIRENLPRLKQFHFKISTRVSHYRDLASIQSMVAAFRTPFWLEHKRWYVTFQNVINDKGPVLILRSSMDTNIDSFQNIGNGFISYFTSTTKDDDGPKMRNVWNACINLPEVAQAIDFRQFKIPNYYLFDKVIRLALDIDWYDDWKRSGSFELLSKLIDLSQLTEVWFLLSRKQTLQASTINTLLERAPDVHTFGIRNNGSLRSNIEDQCSALSPQIDHLIIRSMDIDAMKLILERVEHISTITFICEWSSSNTWTKMIKWLREKERKFSTTADHLSLQVWFKKSITESSEVETINQAD